MLIKQMNINNNSYEELKIYFNKSHFLIIISIFIIIAS